MSPGNEDGSVRLRLVGAGESSTPPPADADRPPSNPAASAISSRPPAEPLSLPPRFADPSNLRALINGETRTHYESTLLALGELANPRAGGGYEVSFPFRNTTYRLFQGAADLPIELTVTQDRAGKPTDLLRMSYLPDGQIKSSIRSEAHAAPEKAESTHHRLLHGILAERAQRILIGQDLYVRLRHSLEALKGRYAPETQSVWHDRFVVHGNKIYTFRIRNLLGLSGIEPNPQTSQISIYQEGAAERVKLLTISATGENNWEPNRLDREPLSSQQLDQLKKLVGPLEQARVDPKAYEQELHANLRRLTGKDANHFPEIARSVDIPKTFGPGFGPRGEPILEIRSGRDLWRNFHPWATHRWQNPENPVEVRQLSPPWRLSWHMNRELWRWIGEASRHASFGQLTSPRYNSDLLRLQLFPEGGGQVTLYREGNIHDILIAETRGPVWRASREIERMAKKGAVFENRLAALQAAVAARGTGKTLPDSVQVQEAPFIDLDRIHLNPDDITVKISDAVSAWRRIQLQIPEGVSPRVQSASGDLLPTSLAGVDRIHVDFRESQPLLQIEIRHHDIPTSGGEPIRRVEIVMRRGEDTHARVFEDGFKRPGAERDIHRTLLTQAQEGNLPANRLAIAAQFLPRLYGYYKTSGGTYALSYFGALPFTLGFEHLYLTQGERQLVGTPTPHFDSWNSFLHYFIRDFSLPFMTLSTTSGVTGVATDGLFNIAPGVASTWRMKRNGATFAEAWRLSKPSFYNEYPHVRPIGRNPLRALLQRSLPLFTGLIALEHLHHGKMSWTQLKESAIAVGGVSLASTTLLNGAYRSQRLSSWLLRHHWIEDTLLNGAALAEERGAASTAGRATLSRLRALGRGSRYALTFRGGVWVATLETIALGIWMGVKKREWVVEMEDALRGQVGNALDRRNELITRLEHREAVPPRLLMAADHNLRIVQKVYRRLLDLREQRRGSGNFSALGLDNDFAEAYALRDRQALLAGDGFGQGLPANAWLFQQEQHFQNLRERGEQMEQELRELYTRHGMGTETTQGKEENLREFLHRLSSDETLQAPSTPPVSVESPEGQAILEHFRWKAVRDPSFASWNSEQRARYLLRQFRAYRVREADGSSRPWRSEEALAFLAVAETADIQGAPSLEEPPAPPKGEEFDSARLDALLQEECRIRARETASRPHAREHARILAHNVADFDAQMVAYYRTSNERMAVALETFLNPPALASNDLAALSQ